MKAIFGGSVKKPLMAKVSMRHLNEIVRERNQYSRDAMEAWQDFINLKGRMDGELTKVTKRNNFLVDELESWKQQVTITLHIVPRLYIDSIGSSSNSRLSPNSSLRRHKSSRSRLRLTNAKIAVSRLSSSNIKTMPLVLRSDSTMRRSTVTMLLRRLSSSKILPKSSSASASATRRSSRPSSTQMPPFSANATSLDEWSFTFVASSMGRLTTWSTLCAPSTMLLNSAITSKKVTRTHPRTLKIMNPFQAASPLIRTRTYLVSPGVRPHALARTRVPTSTTRKSLQKWNPGSSHHPLLGVPVAAASA